MHREILTEAWQPVLSNDFFFFKKKKGNRRIGCLVTMILSLVLPITSTAAWTIHVGGLLTSWATAIPAIPSFEKNFVLALFEKHSTGTLKSVKQRGEGAWFCVWLSGFRGVAFLLFGYTLKASVIRVIHAYSCSHIHALHQSIFFFLALFIFL